MRYQHRDLTKRQRRAARWLAEHSQEEVVGLVEAPKQDAALPAATRRVAFSQRGEKAKG